MKTPKLKAPLLNLCRIAFSHCYNSSYSSRIFLEDQTHTLHLPIVARYDSRPRIGLWWGVTSNTMTGVKVVVRRWSSRRLRHAIREALKERGFDEDGKSLVGGDLTGTLEVDTREGIVKARFEDVKREAGLAIDYVEKLCRKSVELDGGFGETKGRSRLRGKLENRGNKPLV